MPIVTLKMGSSLNPDDIKEGDDIYFDCHIQSNPKPYKLAWYHDVSRMVYTFGCRFTSSVCSQTNKQQKKKTRTKREGFRVRVARETMPHRLLLSLDRMHYPPLPRKLAALLEGRYNLLQTHRDAMGAS